MRKPTSSAVSTYVVPSAPSIAVQAPLSSQRSQVYVKVAAGSLQLPGSTVSVEPTLASPETAGAATTVGAAGTTTLFGAESDLFAPPSFEAVTSTRRVYERSSGVMSSVAPVVRSRAPQRPPE